MRKPNQNNSILSSPHETTQQHQHVSDFIFCHDPAQLKSTIMLSNHEHILHKILKDAVQPYYFWVFQQLQLIHYVFKFIALGVRERSQIFSNFQDMNSYLIGQSQIKIVIISSENHNFELRKVLRRQNFIGAIILCFDLNGKTEIDQTQQFQQQSDEEDLKTKENYYKQKLIKCSTVNKLNECLNQNTWSLTQVKQFGNFVLLKQEVQQSTVLSRTMVAMLKQGMSAGIRDQIIQQLSMLVQKMAKFYPKLQLRYKHISEALKQLMKDSMSAWKIINIYTSEKYKIYIVLNSFLRAMDSPTELYYVQPLVNELFKAIKKLYGLANNKNFICYRGGFISADEIQKLKNSVGEIVQNLGFLSTSRALITAESFKKNVLFEIIVSNGQKNKNNSQSGLGNYPGFALISEFSQYWAEQQILFNPLNYFDILEVKITTYDCKQDQSLFYIVLQYRFTLELYDDDDQSQESINILLLSHQEMNSEIVDQTHVLFNAQNRSLYETAKIFYQFFHEKACRLSNKINSIFGNQNSKIKLWQDQENGSQNELDDMQLEMYLVVGFQMTYALIRFGQYHEAFILHIKMKRFCSILFSQESYQHVKMTANMGSILINLGRYEEALSCYRKCQAIQENKLGKKDCNYLATLNNIGAALHKLNKFEQALKLYESCQSAIDKKSGLSRIDYLSCLNNIGTSYKSLGKSEEALTIYLKCERLRKDVLGQRHPDYISSLNNIGTALKNLKRYQQALSAFKQCEVLRRDILGQKHPDYLFSISNIGITLQDLCRYDQALPYHEKSKNIRRQILGETHQHYLKSLESIKRILVRLNRHSEAFSLLKELVDKGILFKRNECQIKFYESFVELALIIGEIECGCKYLFELRPEVLYYYFRETPKILSQIKRYNQSMKIIKLYIDHVKKQMVKLSLDDKKWKQKQLQIYQLTKKIMKRNQKHKVISVNQSKSFVDFIS